MNTSIRSGTICSLTFVALLVAAGNLDAQSSAEASRDPDVLTAADIPENRYPSAYELLRSMKPHWLRQRANYTLAAAPPAIMVYIDNVPRGTAAEILPSIPPDLIEKIEWLDSSSATQRWGTGNSAGAIEITTRRGL